jgi:uncharacterized glyoxalase superfamily protein PhnB
MTTSATQRPAPMVWHSLRYNDAPAAIDFLTNVFGFELVVSYRNPEDDSIVDHAQLHWPEGGGIMLGSQRQSSEWPASTGHAAAYIVTDHAADIYQRVKQAGFQLLQELKVDEYDENTDSQSFSAVDPEGNMWSFGAYRGEPIG